MSLSALRSMCLGLVFIPWTSLVQAQPSPAGQSPQSTVSDSAEFARLRDQALEEGEAGKTADAIRDYQLALALESDWKEGWWNLGMLEYSGGQFQDAQATFEKVTVLAPNLGIAWAILGLSDYETRNYDAALAHLDRAQALGMKDDEEIGRVAEYHLGLLSVRAGEFDRASALLAASFEGGVVPAQAKIALGLATLRVPLLPEQLDPSREALITAAGDAALSGDPERFADLLRDHGDLPYLHLAYCRSLARTGKNGEALTQCQAETKISPESPLPWIEMSRIQLGQNAIAAALRSAETAVRLSPSNAEAHRAFAEAEQAAGRKAEAEKERSVAASLGPTPPHPDPRIVRLYANAAVATAKPEEPATDRWQSALQEYVNADYPSAAADLKVWLAATPSSGTGWALLGLCEFQLKDYDSALIHLDRSAKLGMSASAESIDQARYAYGVLLVHAGRFDEAEPVLATAWHPEGPLTSEVEFALGLALLRRAQLPAQTPAGDRDLVSAAGRIALLLEKSKYDEAFPQFKALLDRYPSAPFLHYAYGTALIALSEFDQAAAQMLAERTISPRSELPCLRLASISLRQNDPAPALRWAQCALELNRGSVDAHYLLGRAALDTGDVTTAIRELEIASSLSPESPEIHFNLARAYTKAKMTEKAQRERELFSRLTEAQKANPPAPAQP